MMQVVLPEHEGTRLDRYLADLHPDLSRSHIQNLIAEGQVWVNGQHVRASYKVMAQDQVQLEIPPPVATTIHPEDIPLDIFFEDADVLVVNKAAGMTVHPAPGVYSGTLVNALLAHCTNLSGINGTVRPGIVHRLDKETSGLMVVAKSDAAHRGLAAQLETRTMMRRYETLVWGHFAEGSGRIEGAIGRHGGDRTRMAVRDDGRFAATNWQMIRQFDFLSFLSVRLETGRTHQIRVHMAHVHHPVFGDPVYGGGEARVQGITPMLRPLAKQLLKGLNRQMLHAIELAFEHPVLGKKMRFESQLPEDMQGVLTLLETHELAG